MSYFGAASHKVSDVRTFLKDAANTSGIKYRAEAGRKHYIYVPFTTSLHADANGNEVATKSVIAYQSPVHEWTGMDGRFRSSICLKGIVIKNDAGDVINDGSCPFCDSVGKAWGIFGYRTKMEEDACKLVGDARDKHMKEEKGKYIRELKASEPKSYMYMLVALYRTDAKTNEPIIGSNGMPEFDLKVMKLSASRIDKINKQVENAGAELPGSELILDYPNSDDSRLVVSQSTISPMFEAKQLSKRFNGLVDAINKEVDAFDWDNIGKSFTEWQGMTSLEATNQVNELFEAWDKYQEELKTNPNAVYLEYVGASQGSNPSLESGNTQASEKAQGQIGMGIAGISLGGLPDANAVFGGLNGPMRMPGGATQAQATTQATEQNQTTPQDTAQEIKI